MPHYLNTLTFHFSAIDWKAPHKIKYSCFLKGWDEDWSAPKSLANVTYRNLPDGNYVLNVKAIGEAQIWSEPFIYTFNIRRPWWKSGWAFLFYTLILGAGLTAVYLWWTERKKEVEEMQQLLAAHKAMAFSTAIRRKPPPKSDGFLNLVHQTLETHLSDENFGIAELCEILNISRAQLHRKLKKMTGRSTSHYIRSLRLDIAKDMLEKAELNVSEVAFSVGFSSANYFSKVFKAEFGYTPKELK
ncbi:MAG: helix-turn-helix domain-containing protein [Saprospiraceae bacterium]|nr:helix-turn-helix domain-containing protein [Saprospiraceae bacterium]